MNICDGCTACCESLAVNDERLVKPANVICPHCDKGCTIHDNRPKGCEGFDCVYLIDESGLELRPDKTGVIFEKVSTRVFNALIMKGREDDWKSERIEKYIQKLNDDGISVIVSSYDEGLIEVYETEDHDKDKVVQFATGIAQRWQQLHILQI